MDKPTHSITLLPQPNDYTMQPRLGDQADSLTQNIQQAVYESWKKHRRPPNSIHCSNYWHTCDFAFMAERRGLDPGWEDFNISNTLAAEAGDDCHINFQKYLVDCGFALKIPSFDPDEERRNYEREHGILVDAIEINLWDYYKPYSQTALGLYTGMGYSIESAQAQYEELVNFYRFGVRLDSYIVKPGAYDKPMPCEIKSTKEKKFNEIKDWVEKYLHWQKSGGRKNGKPQPKTPQKVIDYNNQVQMQAHFMPDPLTGKIPVWSSIYIVNTNNAADSIELFVKYSPAHVNYWLPRIRARKLLWDSKKVGDTNPTKDNCFFCLWNTNVCQDEGKFPRFGSWKQQFNRGTEGSAWQGRDEAGFEFLVQAS